MFRIHRIISKVLLLTTDLEQFSVSQRWFAVYPPFPGDSQDKHPNEPTAQFTIGYPHSERRAPRL